MVEEPKGAATTEENFKQLVIALDRWFHGLSEFALAADRRLDEFNSQERMRLKKLAIHSRKVDDLLGQFRAQYQAEGAEGPEDACRQSGSESMANSLLSRVERKILQAYAELGHDQGWSFLYTPKRTFSKNARFLFMGLNPGGSEGKKEDAELSTERGNAYNPEVEDWKSPLQDQVVEFYKILSKKMNFKYRETMDGTLAANFCPFRSRSWAELPQKEKTIDFCDSLWREILGESQINTIVCLSSLVHQRMITIIEGIGGRDIRTQQFDVGWGTVQYYVTDFFLNDRKGLMICLPHLSRYKIFGRDGSASQVDRITDLVADSLAGWEP